MQDVQDSKITKLFTRSLDPQAGVQHLDPRILNNHELRRYTELVGHQNLPEAWRMEIVARRIGKSTSNRL